MKYRYLLLVILFFVVMTITCSFFISQLLLIKSLFGGPAQCSITSLDNLSINSTVRLQDIYPFKWDYVEVVNSPMGGDFDWEKLAGYEKGASVSLSQSETMSALIFFQGENIVHVDIYNYGVEGAVVFRPYAKEDIFDYTRYEADEAVFRVAHIDEFGAIVLYPLTK